MYAEYPDMVDVDTCGRMLGCGKTKVYQVVKQGKIRAIKIGRKMLIPKSDTRNIWQ